MSDTPMTPDARADMLTGSSLIMSSSSSSFSSHDGHSISIGGEDDRSALNRRNSLVTGLVGGGGGTPNSSASSRIRTKTIADREGSQVKPFGGQLWIWGMGRNGKYDKLTRNLKEPRPLTSSDFPSNCVTHVACSASHALFTTGGFSCPMYIEYTVYHDHRI